MGLRRKSEWKEPTWATADRDDVGCRLTNRLVVTSVLFGDYESDLDWRGLVVDTFGEAMVAEVEDIGAPTLHHGTVGRGGEVSTVLLEWIVEPAAKGVVSLVAAQSLKRTVERLRGRKGDDGAIPEPIISAGMAVALAVAEVGERGGRSDDLRLDGVFEPAELRESHPTELNYVGIEPWIVVLASPQLRSRHLVVVKPNGDVENVLSISMTETEAFFMGPS